MLSRSVPAAGLQVQRRPTTSNDLVREDVLFRHAASLINRAIVNQTAVRVFIARREYLERDYSSVAEDLARLVGRADASNLLGGEADVGGLNKLLDAVELGGANDRSCDVRV